MLESARKRSVGHSSPSGSFTLLQRPAKGNGDLSCWLALPDEISSDEPPLVAVHGIGRGVKDQAEAFAARAALTGRPVIAPHFGPRTWPRYQQVVRKKRADIALLALMTKLRLAGIWRTRTFELFGYSGGAQFAHRFAMLYPHMISRLTVAAAGWYTFPDGAAFPYGLGKKPNANADWGGCIADGLVGFLGLPIQVCVGAEDNQPDQNTRNGTKIDLQQGPDRLSRAGRWVDALRHATAERGLPSRVTLAVLPGCGHDFRQLVEHGGLNRIVVTTQDSLAAEDDLASDDRADEPSR